MARRIKLEHFFILLFFAPSRIQSIVVEDVEAIAGEDVILPCKFTETASEKLDIEWSKDGISNLILWYKTDNEVVFTKENSTGLHVTLNNSMDRGDASIRMSKANAKHTGNYTCKVLARSGGKMDVKKIKYIALLVKTPPSVPSITVEGEMLKCNSDGDKPITYRWEKNGILLAKESTSTLALTQVKDAGAVRCLVKNEHGNKSKQILTGFPTPSCNFMQTSNDSAPRFSCQFSGDVIKPFQLLIEVEGKVQSFINNSEGSVLLNLAENDVSAHEYMCKVTNKLGESEPCSKMKSSEKEVGFNPWWYLIAAGAGILLFLIILITCFVCCIRGSRNQNNPYYTEELLATNPLLNDIIEEQNETVPTILWDDIQLNRCIQRGERYDMYKADVINFSNQVVVAKRLRDDNENNILIFKEEIRILIQVGGHPHIIKILAKCTTQTPLMYVMESASGCLKQKLVARRMEPGRNSLSLSREILSSGKCMAVALAHLHNLKICHWDVAARNVLLAGQQEMPKLAGFGLAAEREVNNHPGDKVRIPVRWYPPEYLVAESFGEPGEIWSFGVLLWEMINLGQIPYPDLVSTQSVSAFIKAGKTMNRPSHCSTELFSVIEACWNQNPSERPSFEDLKEMIHGLLISGKSQMEMKLFKEECGPWNEPDYQLYPVAGHNLHAIAATPSAPDICSSVVVSTPLRTPTFCRPPLPPPY
uniref:fibroblast growth factor receptor 3-like n=1 Tax=Myxine glutinosa TaxID=7769 RepID=UPI00358E0D4F